jgi:hypothetical protein
MSREGVEQVWKHWLECPTSFAADIVLATCVAHLGGEGALLNSRNDGIERFHVYGPVRETR